MTPRSGEELNELEARQEPRLVKALEMVAPGTAVREGIDNIVHARTGGLIATALLGNVLGARDEALMSGFYTAIIACVVACMAASASVTCRADLPK